MAKKEPDLRDLLNSNKFIPVYLDRKDKEYANLAPFSVELHITSVCNYNCYHCSYANRNKKHLLLPEDVAQRLVDDLSYKLKPNGVYFSGGGEPTTMKNWQKYMDQFLDNDIEVALITNGSLLKEKHLSTLSRLNYIAVSIYSTHENIYKKITEGANFNSSFALPNMIKSAGGDAVVGARCVISKFNYAEVADIYNRAIDSRYDYIIFIPEIDYEKRGITLTDEQISVLKKEVADNDIKETKTNLLRLARNDFKYYSADMDFAKQIDCNAIKLRTNAFVNYDGGVWLCQPHIGKKDYCIGNLYDNDFSEIWNSPQHKKVIDKLQKEWHSGRCENCRSISFNKALFDYLHGQNEIKIIKDNFL